jgi:dihydropyrimidinase
VLFDPDGEVVLGPDGFDDGTGDSVYAGLRVRGQVRAVLLRGHLVAEDGTLAPQPGRGRYLAAQSAQAAPGGPGGP